MITWKLLAMKLPKIAFVQPGAVSATEVVPVSATERPRTRPCTAKSVPSVTISEGTAVRTVRNPLIEPDDDAEGEGDTAMPTTIGAP